MQGKNWRLVLIAVIIFAGLTSGGRAQKSTATNTESALHIDIPTHLDKANVVVDFGHLVFGGDMPFALGDIRLLATDLHDWGKFSGGACTHESERRRGPH
jgi:hypothetical protein